MFKPNLIPNSKVDKPIDLSKIIGNDVDKYVISYKKDGCRVEIVDGKLLTRALKPIAATQINEKYKELAEACAKLDIILEGEYYAHGMSFREICRFFKTSDVSDAKHMNKLATDCTKYNLGTTKDPIWKTVETFPEGAKSKFETDWPGRTVEWMSTYHEDLKIHLFDIVFKHAPSLEFVDRMRILKDMLSKGGALERFSDIVVFGPFFNLDQVEFVEWEAVEELYELALEQGWEGLVLSHINRTYKNGRSTAKAKELYKMKEDKLEFDGCVIDIIEGTVAIEGAPKTKNELGRSVTSKLAEHRKPSGMASGILTLYQGNEIKVSFEGYSHEELREILQNKQDYLGKWFVYTGMKPTKNVPRHAHLKHWRDDK